MRQIEDQLARGRRHCRFAAGAAIERAREIQPDEVAGDDAHGRSGRNGDDKADEAEQLPNASSANMSQTG